MKEIIITVKQQKREIFFLLLSLFISLILNVLGIIIYKTPFTEFFTELPNVLVITLFFYIVTVGIRIGILTIKSIIKKMR